MVKAGGGGRDGAAIKYQRAKPGFGLRVDYQMLTLRGRGECLRQKGCNLIERQPNGVCRKAARAMKAVSPVRFWLTAVCRASVAVGQALASAGTAKSARARAKAARITPSRPQSLLAPKGCGGPSP